MNITPEQLKEIAEALGYKAKIIMDANTTQRCYFRVKIKEDLYSRLQPFNPLENDSQLLELIPWLGKRGWKYIFALGLYGFSCASLRLSAENKNFKHAVLEAVIKELGIESPKDKDNAKEILRCCDSCNDGEGECLFPCYGLAPHKHVGKSVINNTVTDSESEWPSNFFEDCQENGVGTYDHCLDCGRPNDEKLFYKDIESRDINKGQRQ